MTDDKTMRRPAANSAVKSAVEPLGLLVAWSPDPQSTGTWIVPDKVPTTVGRSADADHCLRADRYMSRIHARISQGETPSGARAILIEPQPSLNATQLNLRAVESPETIEEGDVLRLGTTVFVAATAQSGSGDYDNLGLLGISPQMERIRKNIATWAKSPQPIHIQGETGTGKELAAIAIHRASQRGGRFVSVNAAAIPVELADSHLFGHRKGSFSGADRDHAGFFSEAQRGTLFLDEVVELPPVVQAKLLRAIGADTRVEIQRVGDARPSEVDVRLLTATHVDVTRRFFEGGFRQDLYHRLTARQLHLPPLRQRQTDISGLVFHFIGTSGKPSLHTLVERDIELSWHIADIIERFLLYQWPGNIRELRNQCLRIPDALETWLDETKPTTGPFGTQSGLGEFITNFRLPGPTDGNVVTTTASTPGLATGYGEPVFEPKAAVTGTAPTDPDGLRPEARRVLLALRNDSDLLDLIRSEFHGNVRSFAVFAAELLDRKVENVRRQVYVKLGSDGMRKLRDDGG